MKEYLRRSGITTGKILEGLGKAILDPGTPVLIEDKDYHFHFDNAIKDFIDTMKLEDIVVRDMGKGKAQVTSYHFGFFQPEQFEAKDKDYGIRKIYTREDYLRVKANTVYGD